MITADPMAAGLVVREGRRIAWQEFGAGDDVLLLMPTWSIVHSDFWHDQVPYFAERYRVIAFDGLGNGGSDRPTDPRMYGTPFPAYGFVVSNSGSRAGKPVDPTSTRSDRPLPAHGDQRQKPESTSRRRDAVAGY